MYGQQLHYFTVTLRPSYNVIGLNSAQYSSNATPSSSPSRWSAFCGLHLCKVSCFKNSFIYKSVLGFRLAKHVQASSESTRNPFHLGWSVRVLAFGICFVFNERTLAHQFAGSILLDPKFFQLSFSTPYSSFPKSIISSCLRMSFTKNAHRIFAFCNRNSGSCPFFIWENTI